MKFKKHIVLRLTCLLCLCGMQPLQADEAFIIRPAKIDSLDILVLESFPVQVQVRITGTLGDSCTTRDKISQKREAGTFFIEVTTRRPAEAMCAQVVATFHETVPLDVVGLQSGTYTVDVNGVTDTFVLTTDNRLPARP